MTTTAIGPSASPVPVETLDRLLDAVSGERMAATAAALVGDGFAGRRVGSAGGAAARAWLGQRLADLGAAVAVEPFAVRAVPEICTSPSVRWYNGTSAAGLAFGRQVSVHLASADTPLVRRGGLAVAGAGDPVARWLVVPAGMSLFEASGRADRAAGLLVQRAVDGDGWQYTMLAGPNPGPIPVLTVGSATHAALQAAAPAAAGAWVEANAPMRRVDVSGGNLHGRRTGRVRQPASRRRRPAVHWDRAGIVGCHSPADTPDRVDPATMTALARLVVATAWLASTGGATLSSSIGD